MDKGNRADGTVSYGSASTPHPESRGKFHKGDGSANPVARHQATRSRRARRTFPTVSKRAVSRRRPPAGGFFFTMRQTGVKLSSAAQTTPHGTQLCCGQRQRRNPNNHEDQRQGNAGPRTGREGAVHGGVEDHQGETEQVDPCDVDLGAGFSARA
ncbi:hypothetical protein MRX96_054032 [Rhipicephalus microplus]